MDTVDLQDIVRFTCSVHGQTSRLTYGVLSQQRARSNNILA
ncbi:hypothetical protein QNH46_02815 [Paenibacillus woosongensis]|uniref:Uncharacterized protein n=1 Tax=Paenibacillus woosongensis TaxID=307580 RepID=A0AA95I8N3_9BACL|nr:hypothetical protein [Paenibacillus woosongensis]WHX49633.1 hypothetical protein QNH46_02815 [Paenibacillus woosongensis]